MCGISGKINFSDQLVRKEEIQPMMDAMKHRGPDDEGIFVDRNVGFGFVRLSIIDLSPAGHQPFQSEDGRFTMIFNGEIFNYIELREELIQLGHRFNTKTDTEVLLNAYIQWGEDALHKLNGMWAMAVYDSLERRIFCSRDRFGIKPFYYHISEDSFYFASEIPSILSVTGEPITANRTVIFDYLVFNRTEQTEQTFFSGIKKLVHGHSMMIDTSMNGHSSGIKIQKWYNINERVKKAEAFPDPESYKIALTTAITLRLRSDVPIGVSFSGGLDSSAICSIIIDDIGKTDLNTFSAVYDSSFSGDESRFIKLYESKPGKRHYTTPTAASLLKDLERFVLCHGEPLPTTGPYAQFKVMELAAEEVVVTLDGQGADEQLAGYHYFFGFYYKDLLKKLKWYTLAKEIFFYLKIHKSLLALKSLGFFLLPKGMRTKVKVSQFGFYKPEFIKEQDKEAIIADRLYGSNNLQEALINHFEYKLEHLLKWEDRNSMFYSLEARVPFLDYRLVERTLASDPGMIIKNGMTKHLLRESMKGILPESIRMRVDKNGFSTPQDEWFRTIEWQEKIWSIIRSESFRARNIYDVDKVQKLYQQHLNGEKHIAREIWKWVHLEMWYRTFIDQKKNKRNTKINTNTTLENNA